MNTITIFLIALGLAADAFAVSVANGIVMKRYKIYYSLVFGLYFGFFQLLMPVIGYYAGYAFSGSIQELDHWIAFGLLSLIGGKMLWETFRNTENAPNTGDIKHVLSARNMCPLALATSIDALAVGVSFAVMNVHILAAAAVIGVIAFILSAIGVAVGKKLGHFFQKGAERIGGFILIAIAIRILIEHLRQAP